LSTLSFLEFSKIFLLQVSKLLSYTNEAQEKWVEREAASAKSLKARETLR